MKIHKEVLDQNSERGGRGSGLRLLRAADCRIHKIAKAKLSRNECTHECTQSSKIDCTPQVTWYFKDISA